MNITQLKKQHKDKLSALKLLDPSSDAYKQLNDEANLLVDQIREKEYEVKELQSRADAFTVKELVEKYHIAYLADDDKFCITWNTSSDPNSINVISKTVLSARIVNSLNTLLPNTEKIQKFEHDDIVKYCQNNNRAFFTMTSSFNVSKWKVGCYNQLTDLRKFWVEPSQDDHPRNQLPSYPYLWDTGHF
jgi:hypothetical protein